MVLKYGLWVDFEFGFNFVRSSLRQASCKLVLGENLTAELNLLLELRLVVHYLGNHPLLLAHRVWKALSFQFWIASLFRGRAGLADELAIEFLNFKFCSFFLFYFYKVNLDLFWFCFEQRLRMPVLRTIFWNWDQIRLFWNPVYPLNVWSRLDDIHQIELRLLQVLVRDKTMFAYCRLVCRWRLAIAGNHLLKTKSAFRKNWELIVFLLIALASLVPFWCSLQHRRQVMPNRVFGALVNARKLKLVTRFGYRSLALFVGSDFTGVTLPVLHDLLFQVSRHSTLGLNDLKQRSLLKILMIFAADTLYVLSCWDTHLVALGFLLALKCLFCAVLQAGEMLARRIICSRAFKDTGKTICYLAHF